MPTSGSSAAPGDPAAPWITTTVGPPLSPQQIEALRSPLPTCAETRALKHAREVDKEARRAREAARLARRESRMTIDALCLAAASPKASPSMAARRRQGHAASMFPAAGWVTQAQASFFLDQEDYAWYWKPYPRGPFRTDITNGVSALSQSRFDWRSFVTGRTWYRTFIKIFKGEGVGITRFEVAWDNRLYQSVFIGTRADGEKFTVNPRAKNQQPELSWRTDDIAEMEILPAEV